ncbi:MAG TPA: sigma-54 dependent transcriptional regulator [Bryobacteraceae bacterium]|jgi:DNA-binding NtrC family response regulator|nr:sigma-54 dependent transcriptional regulator [Bryobacteraceae bacterium]
MIELIIFSRDGRLQSILQGVLGTDYRVGTESKKEVVKKAVFGTSCDLLVVDLDSAFTSSRDYQTFLEEIRSSGVPVVVMTSDGRRSTALELVQCGVYDYVSNPPSLLELKIVIQRAYEHASLKKEVHNAREALHATRGCDRLIGSSGRSQVLYNLIRRVANLSASVLITGESGTGKELVARAIHNQGNRAKAPFVAVSCGAIPETLIESELFGHEKGAFTGTAGARQGYLEQAGEGTILLDEIGELSLATQVKLLRVLQQKEFSRLGSSKLVPLKARVLFATHRDLSRMVEEGTFRRDLYFRVNVMRIEVAALRDRTEDIPALAHHFLQQYAAEYEKPVRDILPSAQMMLVDYDWPGNVRELENMIQGAVILAEGESISPEDLPDVVRPVSLAPVPARDTFEDQVKTYKLQLVTKALETCNGNKTLAARSLSISRAYLHRLLRATVGEDEGENVGNEDAA